MATLRIDNYYSFAIAVLLGVIYIVLLCRFSKNNKLFFRLLGISAGLVFLANFAADFIVISKIANGDTNLFSVFVLSLFHSLELFIFQTHFFDNGYQEFFFGFSRQGGGEIFFLYVFAVTFVLACITSFSLIIKAISLQRAGRAWLADNKDKAARAHIFFSGKDIAETLAENIKKTHPESITILVDYRDPEEKNVELSVWNKIKRILKSRTEKVPGPFDSIVYARVPLKETFGEDICRQMRLRGMDAFLKTQECNVYLLSDNEEENLHCTELLHKSGCAANIYCRACKEGVNRMYEDAMMTTSPMKVHLVDSSFLAVRNLKNSQDLLPVKFVDKGTDKKGLLEGWVSSDFNAMILGFGETGREMLGFLYEYGAFVDSNFRKSPFSCVVIDKKMDSLEETYRKSVPGINETTGVTFKEYEIGSNEFWNDIEVRLQYLNYIVVCLGDDRLNLNTGINLLEYAYRKGKDLSGNFVILIAQEDPTYLNDITLNHYNCIPEYKNCIKTFANKKDIWTYDNITNESLRSRAERFFGGYMKASGESGTWKDREDNIATEKDFSKVAKLIRQRSQDYANCLHIDTKFALIGPEISNNRQEIARCIPSKFKEEPVHYNGKDKHVEKVLLYLAVLEHIRWEASHIVLGYTPGGETNDLLKIHKYIKDFNELDQETQHYDYLVVKTTLQL